MMADQPNPKRRIKKSENSPRDWHDIAMLVVNVTGVVVIVVSILIGQWNQASNGKDVRDAIDKMAAIAKAMHDEKPLLTQQADASTKTAAAAQVTAGASSHQSADFKRQTSAIVKQADALVASAQATVTAAGAQLASAQANNRTAIAGLDAAKEQRRSAAILAASHEPDARLSGIELSGWSDPPDGHGMVNVSIKPTFTNIGGGTLLPSITFFNLDISSGVPHHIFGGGQITFGGNEKPVVPSGTYFPVQLLKYSIAKQEIDFVKAKKKAIYIWGTTLFTDNGGGSHKVCFIDFAFLPADGATVDIYPSPVQENECK